MKPGVFTQVYIHFVFSPMFREALLSKRHRELLYPYLGKIILNHNNKPIIINGMSDHVHILIGLSSKSSMSDIVHDLKGYSSTWINQQRWFPGKFRWQDGYGAFSYGRSQLDDIYKYIENQEENHRKRTFREEYRSLLELFDIKFEERFLFEFFQ